MSKDEKRPDVVTGYGPEDGRGRIRCPRCQWEPLKHDRWGCECGHSWNTFDTAGVCPRCDRQWRDTQCLFCHKWSPHDDWYEPARPGGSR